jgi:cell division protein FtsI/penicillin-binding protein 2
MSKSKKVKFYSVIALIIVLFSGIFLLFHIINNKLITKNFVLSRELVKRSVSIDDIGKVMSIQNPFGKKENLNVDFTIDSSLEVFIRKTLAEYKTDFSSVVVIDNNNGEILSVIDFEGKKKKYGRELSLQATHPAASIFKIVTAAELLKNSEVDEETRFFFTGRSTTLYKNQLSEKTNRWTRAQSFKTAFATSNNVVFGKAAMRNLKGPQFYQTAMDFGFNNQLTFDVMVEDSTFNQPESQYHLAELASGLNTETLISPLHGAVIASVVANGGYLNTPFFVSQLTNAGNESIYLPSEKPKKILEESVAMSLKSLMTSTIKEGTARSTFRNFLKRHGDDIEIGGKTGSITGGSPYGKRDWFVAYAKLKNNKNDRGISLCVMNINEKKWYVKAPFLAQKIIEYYFKEKTNLL